MPATGAMSRMKSKDSFSSSVALIAFGEIAEAVGAVESFEE
jgi:hypothetical protein